MEYTMVTTPLNIGSCISPKTHNQTHIHMKHSIPPVPDNL